MSTPPPPAHLLGSPDARIAALGGLVDYAGLFPPARLDMQAALAEYRRLAASPEWWVVDRFIVPASRLAEVPADLPLSVVVDVDGPSLSARAGLVAAGARRVVLAEIKPGADEPPAVAEIAGAAAHLGCALVVEVPWHFDEWLKAVARAQETSGSALGAKLRCGGLEAAAFPPPEHVAAFQVRCRELGLPYKLTAGLHHPVRHDDPATGFTHHGFLNVLAAEVLGRDHRLGLDEITRIVAERDPAAFVLNRERLSWRDRTSHTAAILEARRHGLLAYGSCDVAEPVADLAALGILPLAEGIMPAEPPE